VHVNVTREHTRFYLREQHGGECDCHNESRHGDDTATACDAELDGATRRVTTLVPLNNMLLKNKDGTRKMEKER
jgi:hypothetical protein